MRLSVRRFRMPLEGLSFVKTSETLVTFGIIYSTDPVLQTTTEALFGVLGIRDNSQNNFRDKG